MRDSRLYYVALLCFLKRLSVQENLKKTYESELEKYMIRILPLGSGLPAFHPLSTLMPSKLSLSIYALRESVCVLTRRVERGLGTDGRREPARARGRLRLLYHSTPAAC